jgi:uncharacterized protein (TIGR04255 family)
MARPRVHLENAPIVEAVIDFRVLRQEQVSAETFAAIEASIGGHYATKQQIQTIQAEFGLDNGRLLDRAQTQTLLGWRYQTQTEIAQFRVDGFTFSRIEPYTTWEAVSGEAFRLWAIYREIAKPTEVTRIAVRYINRLRLPAAANLSEYIEAPPVLPVPIPQAVREFLTRVSVDDSMRGASAVIVQALEPRVDQSAISLLLDIDAFRIVKLAPDDPSLLEMFGQLRSLKNDIFFASITERTVEMYA